MHPPTPTRSNLRRSTPTLLGCIYGIWRPGCVANVVGVKALLHSMAWKPLKPGRNAWKNGRNGYSPCNWPLSWIDYQRYWSFCRFFKVVATNRNYEHLKIWCIPTCDVGHARSRRKHPRSPLLWKGCSKHWNHGHFGTTSFPWTIWHGFVHRFPAYWTVPTWCVSLSHHGASRSDIASQCAKLQQLWIGDSN